MYILVQLTVFVNANSTANFTFGVLNKDGLVKMYNLSIILDALLADKGVSGAKMARDLDLSKSFATEVRKGRIKSLNSDTAKKLADYFGVTVDYLLTGEEPKENPSSEEIGFDDFTYAFYNETKDLTEEDKQKLLEMARVFKEYHDKRNEEK